MTTWWLTGLTDFHEGAMSDFGDDPDVLNVYQGKIIVLGDAGTGKSSLVKSLNPIISNEKSSTDSSKVDVFSSTHFLLTMSMKVQYSMGFPSFTSRMYPRGR